MPAGDVVTHRLERLYGRLAREHKARPGVEQELLGEYHRLLEQGHRHYHNMDHVVECLMEFDDCPIECANRDAVEMALLYHDIVYEPTASGNEKLSANKAVFDCMRLGVNREFQELVSGHILATCHTSVPEGDAAVVTDIDLSILGSPIGRFSEYERGIRLEYAHVKDEEFKAARTLVLDGFLRRDRIYHTRHFKAKYEKTAKANIAMALMRLRASHA